MNGIVYHLLKDGLIAPIYCQEILMTINWRDYKVHKYTNFVSETFVVFFVAFLHYFIELSFKWRDSLWVACKLLNSNLTTNFDQIP